MSEIVFGLIVSGLGLANIIMRHAPYACGGGHVYAEEIDMLPKVTIGFALVFIVLGIGMFLWTGSSSPTALIPTIFGGLLFGAALFGLHERFSKGAIHAVRLITLLGFLGAMVSLFMRVDVATHEALTAKAIMLTLCGGLLVFLLG